MWGHRRVVCGVVMWIVEVRKCIFATLSQKKKVKYMNDYIALLYFDCRSLCRQSSDQIKEEHVEEPRPRRCTEEGEGESGAALFTHVRE